MKRQDHEYVEIADILRAISHPVRIAIIELLHERQRLNVTEIYEQLGLRQSDASTHLGRLRKSNILKAEREQVSVYYMINSSFISSLMELIKVHSLK